MSYGQFVYRRSSGIYVARLSVPSQFRDRIGRREIHVSTGQRSRHDALTIAAAVADCWRGVFLDFSRLDEIKVLAGSQVLIGPGLISLVDAARALGMEPQALALELTNRNSALMVNASGWDAVDVPDLSRVYREDGYYLWDSLWDLGEPFRAFGLVTLLDAKSKVLDFLGGARVAAWHVLVHDRQSIGDAFVTPNTVWLSLADLLVGKKDVEGLRAAAATVIIAAKVSAMSSAVAELGPAFRTPEPLVPEAAAEGTAVPSGRTAAIAGVASAASVGAPGTTPMLGGGAFESHVSEGVAAIGGRHSAMRVTELIDAFIRAKSAPEVGATRASWKPDETLRTRQKLRCFPEFMGDLTMADLEVMPESEDIIRLYVQRLMTLPTGPNLSKARTETAEGTAPQLAAWVKSRGDETMSVATAQNYRSKLAECFKWGMDRTYLRANPAAGVGGGKRVAKSRPDQDRKTFSKGEIDQIFGMHWFLHGRGPDTTFGKPGKHYRPFYYWLPLLALHCGGRANEIGQLYLADICVSPGGTPYIDFRVDQPDKLDVDDGDDPEGAASEGAKSLKTVNSQRAIPIHSTLLRLGLLEYVEALRRAGHIRLFPELRFDVTKGYGLEARKWFNDRLLGNKLKIPRNGDKTLHSLRHHFAGAIEDSKVSHRIQSQLLGHQRGETLGQRRYTGDKEADDLREHVEKLKFSLPDILEFDVEAGLRAVEIGLSLKRGNVRNAARKATPSLLVG